MPVEQYLVEILRPLVVYPESIVVERTLDEMGVLINLKVHKYDMGVVIGRGGATSNALRALVRIVGSKNNEKVALKILESDGSTHVPRRSEQVSDKQLLTQ